ncbi:FAD binding domain-containing protein [Prauserella cavernicola]|uniref:FAD binding domain-containing protein n=1 Tax=Prauserella cavernicola TaxID=2800127 RepID=A0A934QYP8_9PSEU|nr:FAD binding domain-containing protein [Prauserella cavernicola]MBK1789195.1 FAD binding domain-containing protein [Prauserella cavernicola]
MKTPSATRTTFDYRAPEDLDGLADALGTARGAVSVLGGGTMLVPDISHGTAQPDTVVDLARTGLSGLRRADGEVVVGAMTTYRDLLTTAPAPVPLLRRLAAGVTGGPQIRNRGTVGGSAAFANPSSDVPAALLALRARMRLLSPDGVREVPASDFYTGPFATVRRDDEALIEITLPDPGAASFGYVKFKLSVGSWPIVTATAVAESGGGLRVAVGGAGRVPVAVMLTEPADPADPEWLAHIRERVESELDSVGTWTDELAEGTYRRRIAGTIAARSVAALRGDDERR